MLNNIAKEHYVLEDEQGILREEAEKTLATQVLPIHFGHDCDAFLTVTTQLRMYLEGSDAIDFIAEEIYTIRKFM